MNSARRGNFRLNGPRRQFLKSVGVTGGLVSVAGCSSHTEATPVSQLTFKLYDTRAAFDDLQWNFETGIDFSIVYSSNQFDGVSDPKLLTVSPDGQTLLGELPIEDMTWREVEQTETGTETTIGALTRTVEGRWGKFPRYVALKGDYVGEFTDPPLFGHVRTDYASLVTSGWKRLSVAEWNEQTTIRVPGITD